MTGINEEPLCCIFLYFGSYKFLFVRIQDILITVNNCLMNRAPESIKKLISLCKSKYDLRGDNVLSIPKVNTTKRGLKSLR